MLFFRDSNCTNCTRDHHEIRHVGKIVILSTVYIAVDNIKLTNVAKEDEIVLISFFHDDQSHFKDLYEQYAVNKNVAKSVIDKVVRMVYTTDRITVYNLNQK